MEKGDKTVRNPYIIIKLIVRELKKYIYGKTGITDHI